jgi:hypothetical protein
MHRFGESVAGTIMTVSITNRHDNSVCPYFKNRQGTEYIDLDDGLLLPIHGVSLGVLAYSGRLTNWRLSSR